MQKVPSQKILFIVNPVSGGKVKNDLQAAIKDYCKELPHTIEFYLLTGKSDSTSIERYINIINPDKVAAVGGDGTIKLVAEVLLQKQLPMGIIPAGSANGMAKELSIPVNLADALDIILNGVCKSIDTININNSETCIHLSDMGLNALVVKYFEQSGKRGIWTYGKAIFRVLWSKRILRAVIKTDIETFHRKAYMIVIANASKYGTGATINPNGHVDDGFFEIVVVRKLNFFSLLKMLITHKPFDPQKIEIFQAKNAEIILSRNSNFQVDGEYRGKTKLIKAAIAKDSLKVMLPVNFEN